MVRIAILRVPGGVLSGVTQRKEIVMINTDIAVRARRGHRKGRK